MKTLPQQSHFVNLVGNHTCQTRPTTSTKPASELIVVPTDLLDVDRIIASMKAESYDYYLDTTEHGFHAVFQTHMHNPIGYIYAIGEASTSREATIKAYVDAKARQSRYAEINERKSA